MKKIIYTFLITIILSISTMACYASTTDSVNEATMSQSLMQQFGSDYLPPFAGAEDEMDIADGSIKYKEVDLSLPGKNGFDLNLYRAYDSNQSRTGYVYWKNVNARDYTCPMYKYQYTLNGVTKELYVAFETEEMMVDSFYSNTTKLSRTNTDLKKRIYGNYTTLNDSSGNILLTRDKTQTKVYIDEYVSGIYDDYAPNIDVSIGEGWDIHMPQLTFADYAETTNGYWRTYYYVFRTETGETMDVKHKLYENDNGIYETQESNYDEYTYDNYKERVYNQEQTHSLGFKYNLTITADDGRTYYFNNENIGKRSVSIIRILPVAVTDRYSNAIYYERLADNSVKITDTMGRVITVNSGGITVKGGSQTKSVKYSFSEILDTARDPYNKLDCFTTHILTVQKNQNNTSEKTDYYMKRKSLEFNTGYTDYKSKIVKVVYPTNAYVEYQYESTPTIIKYALNSNTINSGGYDYKEYHFTQKKAYENNTLKNTVDYKPEYASRLVRKTVTATETMPDGKPKKTQYNYDQCGRILSTKSWFGSSISEDIRETKYSYSDEFYSINLSYTFNDIEARHARKAYVMNTRTYADGKLINSIDTKYKNTKYLTHQWQGEQETDISYDENYYIPLTTTTKSDENKTIKTTNALTSDKKSISSAKVYENSSLKNTTSYTYNSDGTVSQMKEDSDEYGNIVTDYSYTYNGDGSYSVSATVRDVVDADGNKQDITTTQNYDYLGRLVSTVDGNGNITSYEYDMADRITKQANPDGTYKTISYNISENSVTVTDENGNATTEDYTPLGLKEKIYLNNNTSDVVGSYTYDSIGRVTSLKAYRDLRGANITENYTYDNLGRVKTQSGTDSANGALDSVTYDYAYQDTFEEISAGTYDVSECDKAILIIHSTTGTTTKTNDITVYVDNSQIHKKSTYADWCEGITLNLKGKKELRISASGGIDGYIKYVKSDDEINLAGGESQTITATYTGDSTYKKPTEIKLIDGFGNTVSESYYQHGTNTLLNKNVYKYDLLGNVIETNGGKNYMGKLSDYTTKTEYDYLGNPVKVYRADGAYTTTKYNKQGQAVSVTDYIGNTSTTSYDQLGRAIKTETPFDGNNNAKILTYYDKNGNITKTRQYNSSWEYTDIYYTYDKCNRLIVSRVNDGSQWVNAQYGYDNVGNVLIKAVSPILYQNVNDSIKNEDVSYETYEYDRFGNVTKTTDAGGRIETAQYNLMGLPVSATDKNGNTTTYTYNAYGSLLTQNNPSENITNTYNVNNLLTQTTSSSSGTITYTYDKYGYMSSEIADKVTKKYTTDVDGNRTSAAIGTSGSDGYMYTSYTYNILDQLTKATFDTGSGVQPVSYTYDKNGRLETETRNGITNTYAYNKAGLMTSNGEGINISYRLDGKESNRTQNGKTTYYAYDKIGQLTSERTGNISTSYTYDGWGNRATKAVGNDITSYEYDRTNRLMSETVSELGAAKKVTEYEYDPNGNLTFKGIGTFADQTDEMTAEVYTNGVEDLATFYTYDAKNRLVGVNSDSGITSYTYDAAGRRKSKTVNGETTKHIWDGDNIVADTTGDNALIAKYYRGVNPVAMVTKSSGALTPYYYHYDEKGSITKLTDKGGKTVQDYTYDAFGNLGTEDDALYNPIRYTGQYTDSETGLIYLRNRYYDPTIGRFTQEDPYWNVHNMVYGNKEFKEDEVKIPDYSAIMQSTNLYVYCMSDPVNGVDLFGTIDWREASDIISRNAWAIKNAGAYYGVNPGIIASCIYTEQILNVNWVDNLTDLYGYWGDTSIGIGQIKVSTAKFLEDAGYIMSTSWAYSYEDWHSNWYVVKDVWYAPAYGYVEGSREWAIANRLTVESENVNYVAAYLAYWQDRWRDVYPEIDGRTAVLATLFNQGELKPPHSNPQPNPFGEQAKKEYAYMRELLGLD